MARWDLHKGENRERTETVSFRVRLKLGVILNLTLTLTNHPNPYSPNPATNHSVSVLLGFLPLLAFHLATTVRKRRDCGQLSRL